MEKIVRDTTKDLFENTLKLARESGALADMDAILDYILPEDDEIQLSDYRFNTYFVVELGGGEGVYISAFIDGQFSQDRQEKKHRVSIGTFKTLKKDLKALQIMGKACGTLTYFAYRYVNENIDRYTPDKELQSRASAERRMTP